MDREFLPLREDALRRYDLYRLRKDPYVTEEIAREGTVRILSPMLINAAQTIRADLMMNPTEFNVIPLARDADGTIPRKLSTMSENVERALAVIWGRLNEGRSVDRDIIWHQLISPFAVMILEFNDFEMPSQPEWMSDEVYLDLVDTKQREWLPWHVYVPDPLTCSWLERDNKPAVFARKYRLLVRDVERFYSHRKGSVNPELNLRFDNGKFRWVSDDYTPLNTYHSRLGFTEVTMYWLDDGENIYHVCMNPGDTNMGGEVLWVGPNPTGAVSAFIVAGNKTPARQPQDRYEPFLWPLMQAVSQINDIRSMRATAARNLAGPHTYITIDPEIQKLYMNKGEKLPTSVRWRKNELHYLLGKVESMPSELTQDWDKVEERIQQELGAYMPSPYVNVVDPAVLKSATATSILHAAEAGMRMYGPLMANYDAAIRDMMEGIVNSVRTYYPDIDFAFHSDGSEMASGRNIPKGLIYRLNQEGVNFPFKITVKTRAMSQAQAAAQYDLALRQWILPDGTKGPATMDDLIEAANYTDTVAQKMKLAGDSILGSIDPWLQQMAIMAARDFIKTDSGIDLPLGANGGGAPAAQPSGIPNSGQRMDAPMVAGPQGGSAPVRSGPPQMQTG